MVGAADHAWFLARLDGVGYGFLIPVFFVVSGHGHRRRRAGRTGSGVTLFVFASILLVRGGSVYAIFRHLGRRSRLTLAALQRHRSADHRRGDDGGGGVGSDDASEGQSIVVAAGMLTVVCSSRCSPWRCIAPDDPRRDSGAGRRRSRPRRVAEDRGFEPLRAFTQPAFQASAIGH